MSKAEKKTGKKTVKMCMKRASVNIKIEDRYRQQDEVQQVTRRGGAQACVDASSTDKWIAKTPLNPLSE